MLLLYSFTIEFFIIIQNEISFEISINIVAVVQAYTHGWFAPRWRFICRNILCRCHRCYCYFFFIQYKFNFDCCFTVKWMENPIKYLEILKFISFNVYSPIKTGWKSKPIRFDSIRVVSVCIRTERCCYFEAVASYTINGKWKLLV